MTMPAFKDLNWLKEEMCSNANSALSNTQGGTRTDRGWKMQCNMTGLAAELKSNLSTTTICGVWIKFLKLATTTCLTNPYYHLV